MAPPSLHLIQAGTTEKEELAIFDPSTGEWQLALKALPEERVGLACGPVKRYVRIDYNAIMNLKFCMSEN